MSADPDYAVTDDERHDHEHRDEEDHGPDCDGPWSCTCDGDRR
jgi:hypothetical protein